MNIEFCMTKKVESYFKLKIVKYGIVGIVSTGIHITAAFLFVYFIKQSLFMSNIFGFSWAYLISYVCQSKFVFERSLSTTRAIKYLLIQILALLSSIGLSSMVNHTNIYLKVVLVVFIMPVITFFIHKTWTFAEAT